MFEVGKLTDESLDSFLSELEKVTLLFELIFKMSKTLKKKNEANVNQICNMGRTFSARNVQLSLCLHVRRWTA